MSLVRATASAGQNLILMNDWRPSYHIARIMAGHEALEDAPEAIQSAARKPIHDAAVEVMNAGGLEARRAMLQRIPTKIRPHVKARVMELWKG